MNNQEIVNTKLSESEKIKKERRDAYSNKITIMLTYMNDLL
jgi:hypothetical protein